ncbi:peptidoglycan DD-metalloendopeptidase family protein [Zobellella maritima]|uniref:peptidoglycan DD-metalloendopeptidase family protein n=1 Tax=Zobellella maritima TaxID=2059725 RepID=UPI0018E57339|nr:peptidoglycan DD-metalloendopeptidase family protein [Zobellella maritima]
MAVTKLLQLLPRRHKIAIGIVGGLMGLLLLLPDEAKHTSQASRAPQAEQPAAAPASRVEQEQMPANTREVSITVASGDSLSTIFSRLGLPSSLLHEMDLLGEPADSLKKIHPGEQITLVYDADDRFSALLYPVDVAQTLEIRQTPQGLQSNILTSELEQRIQHAQAEVSSNFWNAAAGAGLSPTQILHLAAMFAWDLDFALDIRAGDRFAVLFERSYKEGEPVADGHILAAEFVNQERVYQAVRHTDGNYYSPEGRAMRKSFLRAPVNFTHISSNFNPRRLHPVTGQIRAHNGIDYAARTGTPVMAAGNGVVVDSGYNQFNGNYVVIRHDGTYLTKYLHLHKRMVKRGQRVKQEEQIGTVGATGRVTGPHLHYEFLVNGVHKDPKTVILPHAPVLPGAELAKFKPQAQRLLAMLTRESSTMLVSNRAQPE